MASISTRGVAAAAIYGTDNMSQSTELYPPTYVTSRTLSGFRQLDST